MEYQGKAIWITWHEHRRTRSLIEWLEVPAFVYDDHRPLQRNTVGPLWTLWVLLKEKPDVVFCHFSFLLQWVIMIYKYFFRWGKVQVISDCHNKALKREIDGPWASIFKGFKKRIFRGVDLIIVTNTTLVPFAKKFCPTVSILRDPLTDWQGMDLAARETTTPGNSDHVFFVCSFDKDEPVDLIFDSAHAITQELNRKVIISGRIPEERVPEEIRNNPDVVLPGFMPVSEYQNTLFMASAVVVLTEDDDCLVCGAYESLGASRPTVLSATTSLKACFGDSAVYTIHNPDEVVQQVRVAIDNKVDPLDSRASFEKSWHEEWEKLKTDLAGLNN
ncbi:MAG: glycosyltransferase [bacterium]|nr:glycosyltransferase [bacterium]